MASSKEKMTQYGGPASLQNPFSNELSRRDFLKLSTYALASLGLTSLPFIKKSSETGFNNTKKIYLPLVEEETIDKRGVFPNQTPIDDIQNEKDQEEVFESANNEDIECISFAPFDVPFDKVSWAKSPYSSNKPGNFFKEQWPNVRRWGCLVEKYAKSVKVNDKTFEEVLANEGYDLNLIMALIWVESKGDELAKNPVSNATGIMQVMPRDGKGALYKNAQGDPLFAGRPTIEELYDPEVNINWGVRILANSIYYRGSLIGGLDSYYGCSGCGYGQLNLWLADNITSK